MYNSLHWRSMIHHNFWDSSFFVMMTFLYFRRIWNFKWRLVRDVSDQLSAKCVDTAEDQILCTQFNELIWRSMNHLKVLWWWWPFWTLEKYKPAQYVFEISSGERCGERCVRPTDCKMCWHSSGLDLVHRILNAIMNFLNFTWIWICVIFKYNFL